MRKLIMGIVDFREQKLPQYTKRFRDLALTQSPDALFITCSDSRVVPDLLVRHGPGRSFHPAKCRQSDTAGDGGWAIDRRCLRGERDRIRVLVLKVRNIVVCGHSECGAMKAVLTRNPNPEKHQPR